MFSPHIVRPLTALIACVLLSGGLALAALPIKPPTIMVPQPGNPAQWTFNLNVAVDHIPPQFVGVVEICTVSTLQGAQIAQGIATQPLTGGGFSGPVSVPAYLGKGQVAEPGKTWACILDLKDAQGTWVSPYFTNSSNPAAPRPGTNPQLLTQGNL
jgi:hypothetical protein